MEEARARIGLGSISVHTHVRAMGGASDQVEVILDCFSQVPIRGLVATCRAVAELEANVTMEAMAGHRVVGRRTAMTVLRSGQALTRPARKA